LLGQLHHVTEDFFEDAVTNNDSTVMLDTLGSDTNEDALLYFAHMSNQYFCLAKDNIYTPMCFPT
jgi:hypothetical protein